MASTYLTPVLTSAGSALLARAQAGDTGIHFSRIATGNGAYPDKSAAALKAKTALVAQVQTFGFDDISVFSSDKTKLRARLTNTGVSADYYIDEIGIFATDDGGTECLYALVVAAGEHGDLMPAWARDNQISIMRSFFVVVGDAESVTVTYSPDIIVEDTEGLIGTPGASIPLQDLVDEIADRVLRRLDAGAIASGILPIARGGTGSATSPSMLTNVGSTAAANILQASPRPGVTGVLPIANGGTGNSNGYAQNAIDNIRRDGNQFIVTRLNGDRFVFSQRALVVKTKKVEAQETSSGVKTRYVDVSDSEGTPLGIVGFRRNNDYFKVESVYVEPLSSLATVVISTTYSSVQTNVTLYVLYLQD